MIQQDKMESWIFKVMLLGTHKFDMNAFIDNSCKPMDFGKKNITGVNFYQKFMIIDGEPFKMQVWVLHNEDKFQFLISSYCKGASGALILVDKADAGQLELIEEWIGMFQDAEEDITIMVIADASKFSIRDGKNFSELEKYCNSKGIMLLVKKLTSKRNYEKIFVNLTKTMLIRYLKRQQR